MVKDYDFSDDESAANVATLDPCDMVEGDGKADLTIEEELSREDVESHEPKRELVETQSSAQPILNPQSPITSSQSASSPPSEADVQALAQRNYEAKLSRRKDELCEAMRHQAALSDELKAAKAEVKARLESLNQTIIRGLDLLAARRELTGPVESTNSAKNPATTGENSKTDHDEDSWRNASLEELGLSESLFEKLWAAGIETVGDWSDLEAKCAAGREKWPKGIGPQKQQAVGDAFVEFIGRWREANPSPESNPSPSESKETPQEVASENAEANSQDETVTQEENHQKDIVVANSQSSIPNSQSSANPQSEPDPDRSTQVWKMVGEPEFENFRSPKSKDWDAGRQAFQAGQHLESVPHVLTTRRAKEWMKGWMFAAGEETATTTPVAPSPATDPLDDI